MKKTFCYVALYALPLLAAVFCISANAAELTIYFEKNRFQKSKKENLIGTFPEIIEELIKRTETDTEIVEVPWRRGYRLAQTQADTALAPIPRTLERETFFRWLGPISRIDWIFFKKKGRDISLKSLDDAKRVPAIGTHAGGGHELFLRSRGFTNLKSANNQMINVRKLMENRVDLIVSTNLEMASLIGRAGYDTEAIRPVFAFKEVYLYLGFSPLTAPELFKRWQAAFESMRRDGTLQRMQRRTPLPQPGLSVGSSPVR